MEKKIQDVVAPNLLTGQNRIELERLEQKTAGVHREAKLTITHECVPLNRLEVIENKRAPEGIPVCCERTEKQCREEDPGPI